MPLWDPLFRLGNERRWVWLTVAGWLSLLLGPAFIKNCQLSPENIPDFFQEYASARNWREGLPVYTEHEVTIPRYLGHQVGEHYLVRYNAHPPFSVLVALPLAWFSFGDAFWIWNLLSLGAFALSLVIVARQLDLRLSLWSLGPIVTLSLLCGPLWEQNRQGQLSLLLTLLVTSAWAAERSERPGWAGAFLGVATALKLVPGFLLLYYAWRRRWGVVKAGLLWLVVLTAITAAVLGTSAFVSYGRDVLPEFQWFRIGWNNASVWGYWCRLFDTVPERARHLWLTQPLKYRPDWAVALSLVSTALIVVGLALATRRLSSRPAEDLGFALALTAMLLVSPISWEHYFLILFAPMAVLWLHLPATWKARAIFLALVSGLFLGQHLVWGFSDFRGRKVTAFEDLVAISYHFYTLIGLFALGLVELRTLARREDWRS